MRWRTVVWVTHRFVAFHRWGSAPEHRAYLRDRHRHLFHVRVEMPVVHADREVEFHDLLDSVIAACDQIAKWDADGSSCEQMARFIAEWVQNEFGSRDIRVDVSEDGEAGGAVIGTG